MRAISSDRTLWLSSHVLLHEPALRSGAHGEALLDMEIDDVQNTFAGLPGPQLWRMLIGIGQARNLWR